MTEGDPLPDVPVVTIHGRTVSLREAQGPGCALVLLPFRGPW